jgi:lipopolysaccharide transport system ATP-binding protein
VTAPAIRAAGLGKRYRLGEHHSFGSLRETLVDRVRSIGRARPDPEKASIWALRDVSFEIAPGEAVGIIGRNGAGKSTLLKVLSRITEPTEGRAEIRGRVGSLLEVGTGFHPELTGRENISLNGAILGMRRAEIAARFDEIVSFAEVETFIDTPVKRYSSGMYLRLAFAVAAHLEPEILLVDEVLAVGDAAFQKKCLGKMGDVTRQGRTVLFVSHNMVAVQGLCRRALWIEAGRIAGDGEAQSVVRGYTRSLTTPENRRSWSDAHEAPGNDAVRLLSVEVCSAAASPDSQLITVRTPVDVVFEYCTLEADLRLNLSFELIDQHGITVFSSTSVNEPSWHGRPFPPGRYRTVCRIPGDLLNQGQYRINLLLVKNEGVLLSRHDDLVSFDVQDVAEMRGSWFQRWRGVVHPQLDWTTRRLDEGPGGR